MVNPPMALNIELYNENNFIFTANKKQSNENKKEKYNINKTLKGANRKFQCSKLK